MSLVLAAGGHLYSARFGDGVSQNGLAITLDPAGDMLLTGDVEDKLSFGGAPLLPAGGRFRDRFDGADALLGKLAP